MQAADGRTPRQGQGGPPRGPAPAAAAGTAAEGMRSTPLQQQGLGQRSAAAAPAVPRATPDVEVVELLDDDDDEEGGEEEKAQQRRRVEPGRWHGSSGGAGPGTSSTGSSPPRRLGRESVAPGGSAAAAGRATCRQRPSSATVARQPLQGADDDDDDVIMLGCVVAADAGPSARPHAQSTAPRARSAPGSTPHAARPTHIPQYDGGADEDMDAVVDLCGSSDDDRAVQGPPAKRPRLASAHPAPHQPPPVAAVAAGPQPLTGRSPSLGLAAATGPALPAAADRAATSSRARSGPREGSVDGGAQQAAAAAAGRLCGKLPDEAGLSMPVHAFFGGAGASGSSSWDVRRLWAVDPSGGRPCVPERDAAGPPAAAAVAAAPPAAAAAAAGLAAAGQAAGPCSREAGHQLQPQPTPPQPPPRGQPAQVTSATPAAAERMPPLLHATAGGASGGAAAVPTQTSRPQHPPVPATNRTPPLVHGQKRPAERQLEEEEEDEDEQQPAAGTLPASGTRAAASTQAMPPPQRAQQRIDAPQQQQRARQTQAAPAVPVVVDYLSVAAAKEAWELAQQQLGWAEDALQAKRVVRRAGWRWVGPSMRSPPWVVVVRHALGGVQRRHAGAMLKSSSTKELQEVMWVEVPKAADPHRPACPPHSTCVRPLHPSPFRPRTPPLACRPPQRAMWMPTSAHSWP